MLAHHDGAMRQHARSVSTIAFVVAACDALAAQTAHPFGAPTVVSCYSLNAAAAIADVNRDGSLDVLVPGIFFGTLVAALDEDGGALATNGPGPTMTVSGAPTAPVAIAMAGGDLDGDGLDDVVCVTAAGTVHFHKNLGSTRLDRGNFAPDVVVDNFLSAYPISPPVVNYSIPVVRIVDFDRDGHPDIVVAGGPVDRWSGTTCPGFVALYRGDGAGGFQTLRQPLAGSVVDLEVADLDGDGALDHLVVLMETGAVGAFSYEIVHFAFVNGALVATGAPQNLGPGRLTALAMADVVGDSNLDYLVAQTLTSGGSTTAQVEWFQGDGQGHVLTSVWGTFTLPASPSPLGDYIPSLVVGDWNRDGQMDLAVLRGFAQAPVAATAAPASFADSELLVAMGPNLIYAPFEQIPLPGYHTWSSTYSSLFAMLPLLPAPDFLRTIDLHRDGTADLLVTGMRSSTSPGPTRIVTLVNTTPPGIGDAAFTKVGAPSGGAAGHAARIGFEGGRPRPGNPDFACTLLNVQGGCLVGLMWGPFGMANLFSTHGFDLHLAPTEFGCAAIATGSLPGEGFHSFALPIPNQPALVGDAGYFQYCYYDHVSGTFGGTQAIGLRIGL